MNVTFKVGKAKVRLSAEGCVDCGALYSSAWTEAKKVEIQVGSSRSSLTLHRCCACENLPGRTS